MCVIRDSENKVDLDKSQNQILGIYFYYQMQPKQASAQFEKLTCTTTKKQKGNDDFAILKNWQTCILVNLEDKVININYTLIITKR